MKYSARIYAAALVKAISGKSKDEQKNAMSRLLQIIRRNRDQQKISRVLEEAEKIILKNTKTVKVQIESAEPVLLGVKREIKKTIDKKILLSEKINPAILAGIKILINGELLIDSTAQSRLNKLFK